MDDPMIWGVLPNRYFWDPNNMRWSLGSYDICFKNRALEYFFSTGNTLPTHRKAYSPHGGVFQPTMTQVIRLLSDPFANTAPENWEGTARPSDQQPLLPTAHHSPFPPSDPFSSAALTYSTTGRDAFPAPAAYPSRRHSWVHIFPEGMIHQHPEKAMRYFKWGVARLILEADPCPDVVPMWIDGPQQVMNHERGWPRPMPRINKDISVSFGDLVDTEAIFGPYRERWQNLKERARRKRIDLLPEMDLNGSIESVGELEDDELKYGKEAEQLRIDVTMAVRNEVLKVRRAAGLADEDPKRGLAETYRAEGGKDASKVEGEKLDGSVVKPGI
ncbi:Lyso-phosphatidylcholine acyltransferase [Recurvomyces mirabilis]|nr:Lyso-phosphatidylcholine acyltransferase [Recurvomyces mirabilis]